MSKEEIKIHERIAVVETNMDNLSKNMEKVMTNHLPHLQAAIDKTNEEVDGVKLTIAKWSGGIGVVLALVQIILKYL